MRSIKLPSWIERLAGISPLAVPPHVFSLDEQRLAYARFPHSAQGSMLADYRSVPLPQGTFQESLLGGTVRDEKALAEALEEILGGLEETVTEASLVLPDAWLRLAFSEISGLPTDSRQREEVLRWKLKRLVPFRVDELRLAGVQVSPVLGQEEPKRVLLGFALEALLSNLEEIFAGAGIQVGRIDNLSLSTLAALDPSRGGREGVIGVVLVDALGHTLLFARGGEPVLHRYKTSEADLPYEIRERRILRDLRLTRSFLDDRIPDSPLQLVLVAQAPDVEDPWKRWLEDGLQSATERLDESSLRPLDVQLDRAQAEAASSWLEIAPLFGASHKKVAA